MRVMPYSKTYNRISISDILSLNEDNVLSNDKDVTFIVGGLIKTARLANKDEFIFIELNDGTCSSNLQVIISNNIINLDEIKTTGTSLLIEGKLKLSPKNTNQLLELETTKILHVGKCDGHRYPIAKKKITMEFLREKLHLRARTNTISAISRIRNVLSFATHQFFQENNFKYVNTPLITTSDCEGAGEMFQVTTLLDKNPSTFIKKDNTIDYTKDFFGKPTFLTVSGQIQGEMYSCCLGNIYTFGPTFRAEKSHTTRHLSEFWMIEPEMTFATLVDDMNCAEDYIKYCCKSVYDKCKDDLIFLEKMYDPECINRLENVINESFERITYTKAIDLLLDEINKGHKFEFSVNWGDDLKSEHERYICEVIYKKPVIVYNYPRDIKAFYMRVNELDQEPGLTVAAMDVLVPKVGELIGGSQREERLEILENRMKELGLKIEDYEWYLDLRRYGTIPHSGFGLGFERLVQFITGIDNIRDVIPFPRWAGNCM